MASPDVAMLLLVCCRYSQSWQATHHLSLCQTHVGETTQQMLLTQQIKIQHGDLGAVSACCVANRGDIICLSGMHSQDDPFPCPSDCLSALRFTISFAHA